MALKILLADDNLTAQRMGTKILAEAGHEVISVSNGAAAVKKIASEKPDLLILDVYMPGYSGLEVCAKVKAAAETAALPVLLTVTQMEPFNPEDGHKAKADGVMIKPFVPSDLVAVVDKFARQRQAAAKAAAPAFVDTVRMPAVREVEEAGKEEWKAEAQPEEQPQRMSVPHEMAVAPAVGMDEMLADMHAAAAPPAPPFEMTPPPVETVPQAPVSDTALDFQITPVPAFEAVAPVPEPDFDVAIEPVATMPAAPEAPPEPVAEIAPPVELEFTSVAAVEEIQIAPAPELEPTVEPVAAAEPVIAPDPALVTTPEEMAQFVTTFGDTHSEGDVAAEVVDAPSAPEPEAATPAEVSEEVPSVPAEPVVDIGVETAAFEVVSDTPTPEPVPQVEPEPVPEPAPEPPSFAVSAWGAAVAPAREPEPEVVQEPHPDEMAAGVAAEVEQATPAQQEVPVEFESEPPAAAALPTQDVNHERLVEAVNTVLDRYIAGFKAEIVNAIVRELKK